MPSSPLRGLPPPQAADRGCARTSHAWAGVFACLLSVAVQPEAYVEMEILGKVEKQSPMGEACLPGSRLSLEKPAPGTPHQVVPLLEPPGGGLWLSQFGHLPLRPSCLSPSTLFLWSPVPVRGSHAPPTSEPFAGPSCFPPALGLCEVPPATKGVVADGHQFHVCLGLSLRTCFQCPVPCVCRSASFCQGHLGSSQHRACKATSAACFPAHTVCRTVKLSKFSPTELG